MIHRLLTKILKFVDYSIIANINTAVKIRKQILLQLTRKTRSLPYTSVVFDIWTGYDYCLKLSCNLLAPLN